ncbi:MAG: NYN domain-containing protein [Deltaproteobacteria bacterium]|nr:NYN domain-containing protein [Deltaproteobacteria bacterium]
MAAIILIDAWNLIRTTPSLAKTEERDGNAAARRRLIEQVREAAERESPDVAWELVFDGASDHAGSIERVGRVTVIWCAPRSADEVIVERAKDSVALGRKTLIVSNDREVRAEGADAMWTVDFHEHLLQREPIFESVPAAGKPPKSRTPTGGALATFLVERGHLKRADRTAKLEEDLKHWIDYVKIGANAPNKLAKRIEIQLRGSLQLHPDPDPEKTVYRSLKEFFGRIG